MKILEMKTNKITKDFILESIEKQAKIYARKSELYELIKEVNEELKQLNENSPVASFGFVASNDAFGMGKASKTGFVNSPNISYISQLEQEMNSNNINEENLLEIDELKKENESLKKEIEDLKKKK
jgi:ABC-type Fe3+-hydroxamate transport system substrate-binding protein